MIHLSIDHMFFFFFQAEDGIRDANSDWSSDVCSSDLRADHGPPGGGGQQAVVLAGQGNGGAGGLSHHAQIRRASWRGRVEISGVAVSFKKKIEKHVNCVKCADSQRETSDQDDKRTALH